MFAGDASDGEAGRLEGVEEEAHVVELVEVAASVFPVGSWHLLVGKEFPEVGEEDAVPHLALKVVEAEGAVLRGRKKLQLQVAPSSKHPLLHFRNSRGVHGESLLANLT